MNPEKALEQLKTNKEAPEWMTVAGYTTISKGYLYKDETPKQMYWRVANAASKYLKKPGLARVFFTVMWKNWLCPASPILTNLGTERGLPISCYGIDTGDSVKKIMKEKKIVNCTSSKLKTCVHQGILLRE